MVRLINLGSVSKSSKAVKQSVHLSISKQYQGHRPAVNLCSRCTYALLAADTNGKETFSIDQLFDHMWDTFPKFKKHLILCRQYIFEAKFLSFTVVVGM